MTAATIKQIDLNTPTLINAEDSFLPKNNTTKSEEKKVSI